MSKQIALLRGINVGGKNKLPMKDLIRIFEKAGASDVQTYIQSGNVIYSAPSTGGDEFARQVADGIAKRFGFNVPVVLRSTRELKSVIKRQPFDTKNEAPKNLHVAFLESRPTAAAIRTLDPDRSPPDEFVVSGKEIFVRYPNGGARSKLTSQYFDSRLKTVSTARNWNTVLKLLELATG
jgi:uncharacterized protein (DUF1697 family)